MTCPVYQSESKQTHPIIATLLLTCPLEFEYFNESTVFLCLNLVQLMPKLLKFDLEPLVSFSVLVWLPLPFLYYIFVKWFECFACMHM